MTSKTKQSALALLARRDHSRKELQTKLAAKKHAPEDIQTALIELIDDGYLNESRFVEHFIRYQANKGYGPLRIKMSLKERGIQNEMIAKALNIADNAWFISAREVFKKHFKNEQVADYKSRAKQIRFLQYRGFTQEQIKSVLGNTEEM